MVKILKIKVIFFVALFSFALIAQSPREREADPKLSNIPGNGFKEKKLCEFKNKTNKPSPSNFKALANKDKVILQWTPTDAGRDAGYKLYRSENDKDNFVLISSSESNPYLTSQVSSANDDRVYFSDLAVAPGIIYWYKLICSEENKSCVEYGPISASLPIRQTFSNRVITTLPKRFRFESVSNEIDESVTTLQLELPYHIEPHHSTKISIYGPKGECIKTIYKGPLEAGSYQLIWNGDTQRGEMVTGGIFFAVFENEFIKEATKLILIK